MLDYKSRMVQKDQYSRFHKKSRRIRLIVCSSNCLYFSREKSMSDSFSGSSGTPDARIDVKVPLNRTDCNNPPIRGAFTSCKWLMTNVSCRRFQVV